MQRLFTKNATGVAPDGRWYAGDVNALQDAVAAIMDFAQTIGLGSLQIGETTLALLRYGAGEARLTGSLRADGILRGLGGLFAGSFTTAQRDAIPLGSRPYGLVILNTDINGFQWNAGSDAAPAWQALSPASVEVPVGSTLEWSWGSGSIPAWSLLEYGQSVLKASYPALDVIAAAGGYPYGSDATHLTLPDKRGRVSAGKDDMGGGAANRITVAVSGINGITLGAVGGAEGVTLTSGQMPVHNHGINDPGHHHDYTDPGHDYGTGQLGGLSGPNSTQQTSNATTGITIQNAGSGGAHQNVQPTIIVNKFMRAL